MAGSSDTSESVYGLGITPGLGYITGPQGQRAEQEALRMDKSAARRVVVSLVGRERQGKTSLRRLLAGQPFNSREPSTVGLESQLVDTQALDPASGPLSDWRSVKLDTVNTQEYQEVLGRRIHRRLENQRHRIPATHRLYTATLTLVKIAIISYASVCLLFLTSCLTSCSSFPVLGATTLVMFLACGGTFGKRDGFGIAVGIFHLIVMCEALFRLRIVDWYQDLALRYGCALTFVLGVASSGLMEAFVATCLGMSLGLGIVCVFFMSRAGDSGYLENENVSMKPELYLFLLGLFFGLGFVRHKYTRLVVPVMLALSLEVLPAGLSFVFVCGTTIGFVHGLFLSIGRTLFLTLNYVIKSMTDTPFGRHMVRHLVGVLPGLIISRYIFGWKLITSPWIDVAGHMSSVLIMIALNEFSGMFSKIFPFLAVMTTSTSSTSSSSCSQQMRRKSLSTSEISAFSDPSISSPPEDNSNLPEGHALRSVVRNFLAMNAHPHSRTETSNHISTTKTKISPEQKKNHHHHYFRSRSDSTSLAADQPTSVLAYTTTQASLTPRIVVRDFAGHPLYYSAHHVYMGGQCLYVLVFSLVEARKDFPQVLGSVIDWLQSIFLHTGFPDTRVFLVGTHRDHPAVLEAGAERFVEGVGQRLRKEIPRHFHNLLVWTNKNSPLFPVENSLRDNRDADHRYLRQQLLKTACEVNVDTFPVRYFYFFLVLDHLRSTGKLLASTDLLLEECRNNPCATRDRDDLDAMLLLFRRVGEILYFPDDNLLQSVVVLSPHSVLAILSRLVDIPQMMDRDHRFLPDWDRLESTGMCSRALFEHVLGVHAKELGAMSDTVLYLLQTLNLVCPISAGKTYPAPAETPLCTCSHNCTELGNGMRRNSEAILEARESRNVNVSEINFRNDSESDEDNSNSEFESFTNKREKQKELYLIPAALPPELPSHLGDWETRPTDWELLIDGLPVLPHPAFLRLLSVCAAQDACDTLDELGRPVLIASQSCAVFTLGRGRCYKLQWLTNPNVGQTYHGRLLKVVVSAEMDAADSPAELRHTNETNSRNVDVVSPQRVVEFVWKSISEIVRRDFRRCHVRIGVACPCSSPHQIECAQAGLHFLPLCDTRQNARPISACHVPREKHFWCRCRHVLYEQGRARELWCQNNRRLDEAPLSQISLSVLSTPIFAIPQTLHSQICDLLDVPQAFGNDWTALAGQLGKTAREVELLRFRAPRDPCDALLQDWTSRDPDVTLGNLVDVMHVMGRCDVIRTIREFFSPS